MSAVGKGVAASTRTTPETWLDHVGFIVRDLDATCDFLAQLGFTQTARANHTRTNERGQLVSAGSSQRSIMLRNGYVELMQITDPTAGHQLASAPSVRFGLHIFAFGTRNATLCHSLCVPNGIRAGPVLNWARPVNEVGVQGLAQFAYFGDAWTASDPAYLCWVEHRTPQLLRSEQLVTHDNGALAVVEVHFSGPRQQAGPWVARLLAGGARAKQVRADGIVLSLPNALLRVDFDEHAPCVRPSALLFEFADLAWLRKRCTQLGLALREIEHDKAHQKAHEAREAAFDLDLVAQLGLHLICRPAAPKEP